MKEKASSDLGADALVSTPEDGFFSSLFSSATGIIILIILALIVLLFAWFVIKKLKLKASQHYEKRDIKKDLMIWSNLSKLVSGGSKTKQGKEDLSVNIKLIKEIFDSGLDAIKSKVFAKTKAPWFLLLGEPLAGKSSLLSNSGNHSFERQRSVVDARDEECLHFSINRDTVFLDVKGKVFFDNWLGGSSAEWAYICEAINKYHHERPLSGVILTIPADALLADDKDLTAKKATLIHTELLRLVSSVRMHLPIRIMISKCDCILGFREYFRDFEDKLREQAVGFDLSSEEGVFNLDRYSVEFDKFIQRLRDGSMGLMTSKSVIDSSYNGENRINQSSLFFIFPEQLASLKEKIEIYLSTIFSKHFSTQLLMLDGVYLSSALDLGASLFPNYAQYLGKPIDEAILFDENASSQKSYFTRKFFSSLLFSLHEKANFIAAERTRRALPKYTLIATMLVMSFTYLVGAIFANNLIEQPLNKYTIYYDSLDDMFKSGYIQGSPLLDVDYSGNGISRFHNLMVNGSKESRINFFNDIKRILLTETSLRFIYQPSAYLFFDGNNLRESDRNTIYNQVLIDMVFGPACNAFGYNLMHSDELFSEAKADALYAYILLSKASVKDNDLNNSELIRSCLSKIINVMYPDLGNEVVKNITDILDGDDSYAYAAATQIINNPTYTPSYESGVEMLTKQLMDISAYPESDYQVARKTLSLGKDLITILNKFIMMDFMHDTQHEAGDLTNFNSINQSIKECLDLCYQIDKHRVFVSDYASGINANKSNGGNAKEAINLYRNQLLNAAYLSYKKVMTDDFNNFINLAESRYSEQSSSLTAHGNIGENFRKVKSDTLISLQNDFAKLKKLADTVNEYRLFDHITVTDKNSEAKLRYAAYETFFEILYVPQNELNPRITTPGEYKSAFKDIVKLFESKRQLLLLFFDDYKNDDLFVQFKTLSEALVDYSEYEYKVALTRSLLELYPYKGSLSRNLIDLSSMVSSLNYDYSREPQMSFSNAIEALGNIDLRLEYNPAALDVYMNPIFYLLDIKNSADKEDSKGNLSKDPFKIFLQTDPVFAKVSEVLTAYTGNYVDYWSTLVDNIRPKVGDYYSFHEFAVASKAYVINDQLLDLYSFCHELLSNVSPTGLSPKTKHVREVAIKNLENTRKSITLQFTNFCAQVLDSWSLLPDDAVRANHYIQTLSKKQIRHSFTMVKDDKSKNGSIPWWTNFIELGTALLKADASYDTVYGLDKFQTKLFYFPILRDSKEGAMGINPEAMFALNRELRTYGIKPPKKNDKVQPDEETDSQSDNLLGLNGADEGVDNLQEPILKNVLAGRVDVETWGQNVSLLLTSFGNLQSPVKAVITIPDIETQKKLIKTYARGSQIGALRFRYVDVSVRADDDSDVEDVTRYPTVTPKEEIEIYNGNATLSDLKFSFFRFSDEKIAQANYSKLGNYAPVRLYLDEDGIYDAKKKSVLLPLNLISKEGEKSVLFIKVKFSKELLSPDDWPSSVNWPAINQF